MEELQIYGIVNSVTSQALGRTDLTVVNEQGLIALGNTVLDSSTHTEDFLNTLVRRIGKTIVSTRAYSNKFSGLMKDNFQWGSIVQKIKVHMPTAEEDESYNLTDNGTVDHYKINKPKAMQKLFITDSPYQFKITIQRVHLETAFTSASAMGSFIGAVYTEVQNAIELALENLARTCLANYMGELYEVDSEEGTLPGARVFNLVSMYKTATGDTSITASTAMFNEAFLRYAIQQIKIISSRFTNMTTGLFNDGTTTRHTPLSMQKLYILDIFESALETQVQYGAFNKQYVELNGFQQVSFWQDIKTPNSIKVARASDNAVIEVSNIVGALFDTEALGMYQQKQWTATTPFNAAGGYINTYWHEKQLWFNDLSENFVIFTLN